MKTIAITGKGGTGKSTISALIIHWLSRRVTTNILAVDADANVNLNDVLGIQLTETIGSIREEMKSSINNLPGGMTKQQFLEYKVQTCLIETSHFDLIAMGRPEGPGCYCYSNNLLRDILKTLSDNYEYVIIDNEAGMEHLSRRTTQHIDYLLIVSDPSIRGIKTAANISRLLTELDTRVSYKYLIINRAKNAITEQARKIINEEHLSLLTTISEDNTLLISEQNGKPIWDTCEDLKVYSSIDQMMNNL